MGKIFHIGKTLLVGVATYLPGVNSVMRRCRGTGGSDSASYCYSVWLRHAVMLHSVGARLNDAVIAELGPGDTVGVGIASLLTGSARHVNLDVIRYAKTGLNLRHLEKIAGLIERRAPIPDNPELERVEPKLDDYSFPRALFPDLRVQKALSKKGQIRSDLITPGSGGAILDYKAPWTDNNLIEANSVDVILSQAVMQSVEDLATVYATLHKWLKPGGMMSHSIDFGSLGMADTWDGHRAYGDTLWALLSGGRPYSLNRLTLSGHLELLADLDFELMLIKPVFEATHVPRDKLAVRFRRLDEQDLRTRTAFIIARKRG